MESSLMEVERVLSYTFRNKSLLKTSLAPCSIDSTSYERLTFVGGAKLAYAVARYLFSEYPLLEPGKLTALRDANICAEKLARAAVRSGLYCYVNHSCPLFGFEVNEFVAAVLTENATMVQIDVKAPKILADIVQTLVAAVDFDCEGDLRTTWKVISRVLEPMVKLEDLEKQPVSALHELCQKHGHQVHVAVSRKRNRPHNGVGSCSSSFAASSSGNEVNGGVEIESAKQELKEFCDSKGWPTPVYQIVNQEGPPHKRRFRCSVTIAVKGGGNDLSSIGETRSTVKDAERSAASLMLIRLSKPPYRDHHLALHRRLFTLF